VVGRILTQKRGSENAEVLYQRSGIHSETWVNSRLLMVHAAFLIPFVEQPPDLSQKHAELVEIPPATQPRGGGGQRR